MWNEINYPFLSLSGVPVEVWEWISNFISHFIGSMVTYPRWSQSQSGVLIEWSPVYVCFRGKSLPSKMAYRQNIYCCGIWQVTTLVWCYPCSCTRGAVQLSNTSWEHYGDVIIGAMASHITSLTIVYSTVYSGADQRKHQSSASLAFVRGIHRLPVNTPHKWPVTRKMFPFDDVIMVVDYQIPQQHIFSL